MDIKLKNNKTNGMKGKRGKSEQSIKSRRFIIISLTPVLSLFVLFFVIPIVWGLFLSLYQYNPLQLTSPFIGLDNFKELLADDLFKKTLMNTFKFVFVAVVVNIALTILIALGINKIKAGFFKNTFRLIYFLPCIAPLAGSAVIWSTMFNGQSGLFNIILEKMGFEGIMWLTDPTIAMYSIVLMTLWADMGFNIILFLAGLDSIPETFYEAAVLDGANAWNKFIHITLPLLNRTTLFITIMTCLSYFQMFPQFQILTKGEPQNSTRVLSLDIYDNAFVYMNMGYASAIATVLFLIILFVTVIQLRLGKSDWEY